MQKFSADIIYPVSSDPLNDYVIVTDDTGIILDITEATQHDVGTVQKFTGTIVPGFVNTHCHMELSHMLGKVDTGTGLLDFIKQVITRREATQEAIYEAIRLAEQEMLENGIVAVGDISNTTDTFSQKQEGNLFYYTFVEFFDLMKSREAEENFNKYYSVYSQLETNSFNKKSCVPHAPYSVSEKLFSLINVENQLISTISIHNQETPPEDALFRNGQSDFSDFFNQFGDKMDEIPALSASIEYALQQIPPQHRVLFVHNTLTRKEDIVSAHQVFKNCFWATCPNANLYIENRLPNYKNFIDTNSLLTIGTDSLTSNWQLSIWEEMKTILRYQSWLSFEIVLEWATKNGAESLGFNDLLGTIEKKKKPGLVLLENFSPDTKSYHCKPKRLI